MSQSTSNIWCVLKREWKGYFATPVAFVFIVIFLVLIGFFTFSSNLGQFFEREEASLASFFTWHPWIYLFLVPSVGMRLWSEERRQGTMELLLTMPVAPWHTILGKFLASWAFLALALLLTFPIILTTTYLGEPDYGPIACGYIGSIFLAGGYLAVSSMTSAITRNQVISFILSVVICLFLVLAGYPPVTDMLVNWAPGWLVDTVTSFSVMTHFFSFQRGVLDPRDIVFFLSLIGFLSLQHKRHPQKLTNQLIPALKNHEQQTIWFHSLFLCWDCHHARPAGDRECHCRSPFLATRGSDLGEALHPFRWNQGYSRRSGYRRRNSFLCDAG